MRWSFSFPHRQDDETAVDALETLEKRRDALHQLPSETCVTPCTHSAHQRVISHTNPPHIHDQMQLLPPPSHTHTLALTLQGWNLMECDLVWRLGGGPLICMQAVFTGIPWPIIIINPDWGIGTPNLTGLYGYSHSRRTGATLYYIL